jgi:hypothetical protein
MAEEAKQEFGLKFTLDELNVIFAALQEGPFKVVQPILQKIQEQVNSQAAPQAAPQAPVIADEDDGDIKFK